MNTENLQKEVKELEQEVEMLKQINYLLEKEINKLRGAVKFLNEFTATEEGKLINEEILGVD